VYADIVPIEWSEGARTCGEWSKADRTTAPTRWTMAEGRRSQASSPRSRPGGTALLCVPEGTRKTHFASTSGSTATRRSGPRCLRQGGERRVDLARVNGPRLRQQPSRSGSKRRPCSGRIPRAEAAPLLEVREKWRQDGAEPDLRCAEPDGGRTAARRSRCWSTKVYVGAASAPAPGPHLEPASGIAAAGGGTGTAGPGPACVGCARGIGRNFTVDADDPVRWGIRRRGGRRWPPAARFASKPGALEVRIATGKPGASPSTEVPRLGPAIPSSSAIERSKGMLAERGWQAERQKG